MNPICIIVSCETLWFLVELSHIVGLSHVVGLWGIMGECGELWGIVGLCPYGVCL